MLGTLKVIFLCVWAGGWTRKLSTVNNTALHAKFQAADVLMSIAVAWLVFRVPLRLEQRHTCQALGGWLG